MTLLQYQENKFNALKVPSVVPWKRSFYHGMERKIKKSRNTSSGHPYTPD